MIKINTEEVNSIKKQAHFLNFNVLLSNLARFVESYSGRRKIVEIRIRNTGKKLFEDVRILLKSYGIDLEYLEPSKVKSNLGPSAFLKVDNPDSLGFILKVVDGRMLVKVNRIESEEKIEAFVLAKESSSNLEKHNFDDLSSFVSAKTNYLKTLKSRENQLKKSLNVRNEFEPSEWGNLFKKAGLGRRGSVVNAAISVISSLEKFQAKSNNSNITKEKEFVLDNDSNDFLLETKDMESPFLIPVGTIVGTTIKGGIRVFENGGELKRRKTSQYSYKEEVEFEEKKDIFGTVGSTISGVFW